MREEAGESLPFTPMRISGEFINGLAEIHSARVLDQIREVLENLKAFPELGSLDVRPSLKALYGETIRKVPVSSFVIVYSFDGDIVDVLAVIPGPSVR